MDYEKDNKEFIKKVKRSSIMKTMIDSNLKEITIQKSDDDYVLKISSENETPVFIDFKYKPQKKNRMNRRSLCKNNKLDIIFDLETSINDYIKSNNKDIKNYVLDYKQYDKYDVIEKIDKKNVIINENLIDTSKKIIRRIEKYFNKNKVNSIHQ